MAEKMREITLVQARRSKKSVQWMVNWEWASATESGEVIQHLDGVRTRLLPAPEFLKAARAVSKAVGKILGLKKPEDAEFSKVTWGEEDKEGDRRVAVTVLLTPEDASAPVAVPVNLKGGMLADELLELERRAFAFADGKELAQQAMNFGEGEGAVAPGDGDGEPAPAGEPGEAAE